jgi:hypothetical protein
MQSSLARHYDGRFAKAGEAVSAQVLHAAKQTELAAQNAVPKEGTDVHPLHPFFVTYVTHLERKGRDPKTIDRNAYGLPRGSRRLA